MLHLLFVFINLVVVKEEEEIIIIHLVVVEEEVELIKIHQVVVKEEEESIIIHQVVVVLNVQDQMEQVPHLHLKWVQVVMAHLQKYQVQQLQELVVAVVEVILRKVIKLVLAAQVVADTVVEQTLLFQYVMLLQLMDQQTQVAVEVEANILQLQIQETVVLVVKV